MNDPLASPKPSSPMPAGLLWLGPFCAAGYGLGVGLRRWAYAAGLKKTRRAPLPVLSVGNLTAGGTGKTPFAAYLAQGLIERGLAKKPAILMRGYGSARPGEPNDEARELMRALGEAVPVVCDPKRIEGAEKALAQGCDAAILDDGFQHWQLVRDLDLVLIDATDPFGGEHLLPWGRLRESPAALKRAHAVIVTRVPEGKAREIAASLKPLCAPNAVVAACDHAPAGLRRLFAPEAKDEPPSVLRGQKVLAVSALGNPAAYAWTLRKLGAEIAGERAYPDHFNYAQENLREIAAAAKTSGAERIVVTEKDAAKLEALSAGGLDLPPVHALRIACAVHAGEAELWALIESALKKKP
ncbi:MAG: tetraacyldisaccharide 4'-kinase [Planctomycetota bacterium]|nr:tetraacyldisaccharide 4'-kinase [Planctomycetota bacterium]